MGARSRRPAWIVVLVSVLLHLVVFTAIGLEAPGMRTLAVDRSRPVAVELVRPFRRRPPPPPTRTPPKTRSPPAAAVAIRAGVHPRGAAEPGGPPPSAAAPPPPAEVTATDENVRAALRQALGCQTAPGQHQTQEEKTRCGHSFAEAAKTAPAVSGIDPALRQIWDAQKAAEAARRDGTSGQADLKAIQNARGGAGPSRKNDINAGFSCGLPFGANAKPGLGGLKCSMSYPSVTSYPKP
jgi:hypothetical protein